MSEIEEFPYLLNQLLRSGTKPEDVVECVEASFAFSRKGCFVCHDAGITSSHFMCDDPNCQGFLNWCCHSCMVKQTTAKRRTYSEGWDCLGIGIGILCIKPCGRKNLKFDEDSIIECRNFENELVKKAFKLPGGNRKLSAKVKRGSKPTDGPKRSNKKNLSTKLVKFILEDAPKPFPFEWKHYDPRKMNQTNLTDEKTKNEIEKQLKDLSEEQLILEIDRYEEYEERREPLKEKLIELVTNDVSEKVSFKWTHYDPNKVYGEAALSTFGKKQPIRTQLEDLTEAQLRLEIARYMHALTLFIKDPFIDTAVDTERDEAGNEIYTDEDGNLLAADAEEEDKKRLKKVSTHRIVYRLPLGPLEKLRSKLDKRTFILERAVELKSLMNGSSSSSGAASSSSEIEDLKSTIDQLKKQADNDREANEQERAAEAAKMASLTEENKKIVKQNESLEDKTTRLEKENSDRQSDVHYLKSVVGDKESLIEQLQSQLFASDTRDHEIEAFKEAATTQQSLYLQAKANVDRMHDEYKALEEKHNETDQKLTTTRNENKALESENAALESKNAGLASTIDQLKMDMKAMMTGDCNNNGSDSLPLLTASFSAKDPPTPPQVSQQSLPSHRHHNGEKETVHPKSAAAAASIPKTVLHLKKQQQRRQQQRRQQQQQQQQRQQLRLLRVEEDDDDDDDDDDEEEEEEEEEGKDDDEEEEEDEEEAGEKDGPKTWQEKCAEPGWTTNHSHVGKRVAKYFPCLAEGRKGQQELFFGEVVRYLPHSEEKKEEESFMVSYEDNDYEECDEQELDDMINLLMGPAAAESTTPAPVLAQLTADSTNGDTGPLSQKRIKKRQRSDSAFSEDDEANAIANLTIKECYHYCTLLRRAILELDYPEPADLPEDKQKLNSLYEEWTAKLRETLGFVDGKSPHLKKYRSATGNEEQKNGSSKNRGAGGLVSGLKIVKRIVRS